MVEKYSFFFKNSFNFRSIIVPRERERDKKKKEKFRAFESIVYIPIILLSFLIFQYVSPGSTTRSIDYDKAVHGYHLEHVVLAWCENDSDAR